MYKDLNKRKEYYKAYRQSHKEKKAEYMKKYTKIHKEEIQLRFKSDINSNGQTKHSIRGISKYILFNQRKHDRLNDYEIHHCFGYDNPTKFIYIPKKLHLKIHQLLRDLSIDSDIDHWNIIRYLINDFNGYTYISV